MSLVSYDYYMIHLLIQHLWLTKTKPSAIRQLPLMDFAAYTAQQLVTYKICIKSIVRFRPALIKGQAATVPFICCHTPMTIQQTTNEICAALTHLDLGSVLWRCIDTQEYLAHIDHKPPNLRSALQHPCTSRTWWKVLPECRGCGQGWWLTGVRRCRAWPGPFTRSGKLPAHKPQLMALRTGWRLRSVSSRPPLSGRLAAPPACLPLCRSAVRCCFYLSRILYM